MGEPGDMKIKYIGFCGADDSVDPRLLASISQRYEWVEWGILFRNDKEGQPRFASSSWVADLNKVNKNRKIKLAAHLCAQYVGDLLDGNTTFLKSLAEQGFTRNLSSPSILYLSLPSFRFLPSSSPPLHPIRFSSLYQTSGPTLPPNHLLDLVSRSLISSLPTHPSRYPLHTAQRFSLLSAKSTAPLTPSPSSDAANSSRTLTFSARAVPGRLLFLIFDSILCRLPAERHQGE